MQNKAITAITAKYKPKIALKEEMLKPFIIDQQREQIVRDKQ